MQQDWNIVAAKGRKVSEQTYRGTKEQIEAYIEMMYDNSDIKAIPAEVVDLNALIFEQVRTNIFKCKDGDTWLFTFKLDGAVVTIYDDEGLEEGKVGIAFFLMFPKFAVQTAKAFRKNLI